MKHGKELAEYLFVDEPRIERYFQQLSGPVQYDKTPVWKVALGITGPSVEGSQSRPGREFSSNEKLEKVLSHIESEGLLSKTRPSLYNRGSNQGSGAPFVAETLFARRAGIEREGKALNIWVSLEPDFRASGGMYPEGALYLVEDFRGSDEVPRMVSSGFSSLYLLTDELDWVSTPLADPIKELKKQDDATRHFASDPIGSLRAIGARFGPERHIYTIYRFRASCVNWLSAVPSLTTVGYPLVIREA